MEYGAPAGGVLCQELLRPTFTGTHFKDPKISRSSIIQSLTILVGFLDWVKPSSANGELCADCKVVIQRVLDHHLNNPAGLPPSVAVPPLANNSFTSDHHAKESAGLTRDYVSRGVAMQEDGPAGMNYIEPLDQWMPAEGMPIFNFQLMDTFDWLRDNEGPVL